MYVLIPGGLTMDWFLGFAGFGILFNCGLGLLAFLVTMTVISSFEEETQEYVKDFVMKRNTTILAHAPKWKIAVDMLSFLLPYYNIWKHLPFILTFIRASSPQDFILAIIKRDARSLFPLITYNMKDPE